MFASGPLSKNGSLLVCPVGIAQGGDGAFYVINDCEGCGYKGAVGYLEFETLVGWVCEVHSLVRVSRDGKDVTYLGMPMAPLYRRDHSSGFPQKRDFMTTIAHQPPQLESHGGGANDDKVGSLFIVVRHIDAEVGLQYAFVVRVFDIGRRNGTDPELFSSTLVTCEQQGQGGYCSGQTDGNYWQAVPCASRPDTLFLIRQRPGFPASGCPMSWLRRVNTSAAACCAPGAPPSNVASDFVVENAGGPSLVGNVGGAAASGPVAVAARGGDLYVAVQAASDSSCSATFDGVARVTRLADGMVGMVGKFSAAHLFAKPIALALAEDDGGDSGSGAGRTLYVLQQGAPSGLQQTRRKGGASYWRQSVLVVEDDTPPTPPPTPPTPVPSHPTHGPTSAPGLSAGAEAGIAIGVVSTIGLAGALVFLLKRRTPWNAGAGAGAGAQRKEALLAASDGEQQGAEFDPYTGAPLNNPARTMVRARQQEAKFDPYTGAPLDNPARTVVRAKTNSGDEEVDTL